MSLRPTPTERAVPVRPADFATLSEALDYAARAGTGLNFHGPRGELVEALDYARLAQEARETGGRLRAFGLEPGDRVGLLAETEGDFARGFLGCLAAGLAPAPMPLPAAFGDREAYAGQLRRIAEVAGISLALAPAAFRPMAEAALEGAAAVRSLADLPAARPVAEVAPDPEALAFLQFSSGTTRAPRGVAVTHRALMANLGAMARHAIAPGPGDRGFSWLPFYHDLGLVGCLLLPVATQMSADFLATRDFIRRPGLWPTLMTRGGSTMSYAPAFGYQLAAARPRTREPLDLSRWRLAGIGGDMVRMAALSRFAEVFGPHGFRKESFRASYGMAELVLGFSFAPAGEGARAETLDLAALERGEARLLPPGSAGGRAFARCGPPLPGHEAEIRDEAGRPLGPGRVGRIFARGPSVMRGYFRDPAATAEALRPGGWLDTGDKGCLIEGELVVTGRAKDLIIVNGRNIWPQDIEWLLETRLEAVREGGAAAFGLDPGSDDEAEGVALVLERRGGPEDAAAAAELRERAAALVRETFGLTPRVALAAPGALPRTSSGKLSRARAREMFRSGAFAG